MTCGVGGCTLSVAWLWRRGYDTEDGRRAFLVALCSRHMTGVGDAATCVVTGCEDPADGGTAQLRPGARRTTPPPLPMCGGHLRAVALLDATALVIRAQLPQSP